MCSKCSKKMCAVCGLAVVLVMIGGINWGLVGAGMLAGGSNWNVVNLLLGSWPTVEAIVYLLVGIATLYKLFLYGKCCGKGGCGCGDSCGCGKMCSCGNPKCDGSCGGKMMCKCGNPSCDGSCMKNGGDKKMM